MNQALLPPQSELDELLEDERVLQCGECGRYSSDDSELVTVEYRYAPGIAGRLSSDYQDGIAPIGSMSCASWECGHCGAPHNDEDLVYMSECYTHISLEMRDAA